MRNNELVLVFFSGYLLEDSQVQADTMACGHFSWLSFSCTNYLAYTMGWTNAARMAQKVRREEHPSPVSPESGEDYRIGRTMPEAAARQVLVV
jgi:hypothetical protein